MKKILDRLTEKHNMIWLICSIALLILSLYYKYNISNKDILNFIICISTIQLVYIIAIVLTDF